MGELKNLVADNQDIVVRVKAAGRQAAMAGLGLVEVLKAEGEKLQAVDVKAEVEGLKALDLNAKAEELKALALELKGKVLAVDAKAEVEKLLAEVQKLFAELVAKGEQRAA